MKSIRSILETEPGDLAGTAADERPRRDRAIRALDVELHRRVGVHDLEGIERPVDLRFLAQRVHARQRVMRLQQAGGGQPAQSHKSQSSLHHLCISSKLRSAAQAEIRCAR